MAFFATSHGKSPCDGIGGTVKRLVARASLQAPVEKQIMTPKVMYDWANENIAGITFLYMTAACVEKHCTDLSLEARYANVKTVPGTRSHHCFIPITTTQLQMRRLSSDVIYSSVLLGDSPAELASTEVYQPGKYVACIYDNDWFIGNIVERSDINADVLVKFMKRNGKILTWPPEIRKDECWVLLEHVICIIEAPGLHGRRARQ